MPADLTDDDMAAGFLSEDFAAGGWTPFQKMLKASIAAEEAKVNDSGKFSDINFDHVNDFLVRTLHTETVWDLKFYVGIDKRFGEPDKPILYIISLDNPRDPDDVVAAAAPAPAPAASAAAAVESTDAAAATPSPAADDDAASTPSPPKRRRMRK